MDQNEKKLEKSSDYEKFILIKCNRPPIHQKVTLFAEELKKKPWLIESNPICVNESMEIIDGQHRFLACKALQIPVYYIKDERLEYEDISTLNKSQTNWTLQNFVEHHAQLGNVNFIKLLDFSKRMGVSYGIAGLMLGLNRKRLITDIKEGSLIFPDHSKEMRAEEKIKKGKEFLKQASVLVPQEMRGALLGYSFQEAISILDDQTDLDKFFSSLLYHISDLKACRGGLQYLMQFKSMGVL